MKKKPFFLPFDFDRYELFSPLNCFHTYCLRLVSTGMKLFSPLNRFHIYYRVWASTGMKSFSRL